MGSLFSKSKKDICAVTVECFYIVGEDEERAEKVSELISANPRLKCRIEIQEEHFGGTVLQLSDFSFYGDFQTIKAGAEAAHQAGKNSIFLISPMPQQAGYLR